MSVQPLYRPPAPQDTATFRFLEFVNRQFDGLQLKTYQDLWEWSTDASHIAEFWESVWHFTKVVSSQSENPIRAMEKTVKPRENPSWFTGSKLNWAENMLSYASRNGEKVAIIQTYEPIPSTANLQYKRWTYKELYEAVYHVTIALKKNGFEPGMRVAAYTSNCTEALIACLATTALGGIWSSAASDFGPEGVKERFEQVKPSFIVGVDAVVYNEKVHNHLNKLTALVDSLNTKPKAVIVIETGLLPETSLPSDLWISWNTFLSHSDGPVGDIDYYRTDFDYPLWILFSSGTTGKPKPIVHRAGGMLLQSKKEFEICAGLTEKDVFFYYTTTGWMMWNFLVSGLSTGATLVLYDGSPLKDPSVLWRMADELKVTVFGTSAKYIDTLSKKYKPKDHYQLDSLQQIYSTGSPLSAQLFDWVYENVKADVILGSITGGTDICSLFAGMNTALPVYRGEVQCRMLGMAIHALPRAADEQVVESSKTSAELGEGAEEGEMICTEPFPCIPLGFWPLPRWSDDQRAVEDAQARFRDAYFPEEGNGVWFHGDHIVITESREGNSGGVIMLGRSDGVLNPGGVRFGSAELYQVLDPFPEIVDSLAVGKAIEDDEIVLLFVKPTQGWEGGEKWSDLTTKIKQEIRRMRSPRHVPAKIICVKDIPYTVNGKRVEVLVKKIVNGAPMSIVNPATLANPNCLQEYKAIADSLR